jgi:hypothetical protein
MKTTLQNFKEFWPYYLSQHENKTCRLLHYIGTSLVLITLGGYLLSKNKRPLMLFMVLLVGYGPAWVGHFFFEKNRPATFSYPLWSLYADFKMFFLKIRQVIFLIKKNLL